MMVKKNKAGKDNEGEEIKKHKLKRPHSHKGLHYTQADIEEGVEIELSVNQAEALKSQGVIH